MIDPAPMMNHTSPKLNEKELRKAIKLYYRVVYESKPSKFTLETHVQSVKGQFQYPGNYAELRLGFPGFGNAKLLVHNFQGSDKHYYSIDTNDDYKTPEHQDYERKIEEAWRKEKIPVYEDYVKEKHHK